MKESLAVSVDHVADRYHCYPGETVAFYTRVRVQAPLPELAVQIALPAEMQLEDYAAIGPEGAAVPVITSQLGAERLRWTPGDLAVGRCYEYRVTARVAPTDQDVTLESAARVAWGDGPDEQAEETVSIAVAAQAAYLRHLPMLYRSDDLLSRFLMLFESFWSPLEQQIDNLWLYFDPRFTPADFLPWLASWLDLVLDEHWPEEKRRRLLRAAASLYRKRGTRRGLQEYLEIYTDVRPRIIEHRARNFRLGPEALLGPGIALGADSQPHTFTVIMELPPEPDPAREREQRRTIEAIIQAEKPAHTGHTLEIRRSAQL